MGGNISAVENDNHLALLHNQIHLHVMTVYTERQQG